MAATTWSKKEKSGRFDKIFTNNVALLGRCASDFVEEGHRVELEFEAVKRVLSWRRTDGGFFWRKQNMKKY